MKNSFGMSGEKLFYDRRMKNDVGLVRRKIHFKLYIIFSHYSSNYNLLTQYNCSTVMFQENVKLCIFQSKNDMNMGFKYIKRTLFFSYSSKKKRLNFTDIPHYQNEIKLKFKNSFSIFNREEEEEKQKRALI